MRTLQEIFNAVIDSGHFREDSYMCNSLWEAYYINIICSDEKELVNEAISDYLDELNSCHTYEDYNTLKGVLRNIGIDNSFKERLWIYRNWEHRPREENNFMRGWEN